MKRAFPRSCSSTHSAYTPSTVPNGSSTRSTKPSISATSRDHGVYRRSGTPTITCTTPQTMAMKASVVNAAPTRPAATWLPPFGAVISATAPTPSASVATPTTTVSSPQTTNSSPRKSTWDFTWVDVGVGAGCQVLGTGY